MSHEKGVACAGNSVSSAAGRSAGWDCAENGSFGQKSPEKCHSGTKNYRF